MAFDIKTKDVIEMEEQPEEGSCRFRGKLYFSAGYHGLFQSRFHRDRSTLHIIAAVLEKHPQGAYFQQHITFNGVSVVLLERNKKVYLLLESEVQPQKG